MEKAKRYRITDQPAEARMQETKFRRTDSHHNFLTCYTRIAMKIKKIRTE